VERRLSRTLGMATRAVTRLVRPRRWRPVRPWHPELWGLDYRSRRRRVSSGGFA
jgi:hypothetical protein